MVIMPMNAFFGNERLDNCIDLGFLFLNDLKTTLVNNCFYKGCSSFICVHAGLL